MFPCASGVADDCEGPLDVSHVREAPHVDPDGATICGPCADELGIPAPVSPERD